MKHYNEETLVDVIAHDCAWFEEAKLMVDSATAGLNDAIAILGKMSHAIHVYPTEELARAFEGVEGVDLYNVISLENLYDFLNPEPSEYDIELYMPSLTLRDMSLVLFAGDDGAPYYPFAKVKGFVTGNPAKLVFNSYSLIPDKGPAVKTSVKNIYTIDIDKLADINKIGVMGIVCDYINQSYLSYIGEED
jgi:hypothetical protein